LCFETRLGAAGGRGALDDERAELERRLARLVEIRAPEIFIDDLRSRLGSLGAGPPRLTFRAPAGMMRDDYVALAIAAAAYALAAGASLSDEQLQKTFETPPRARDLEKWIAKLAALAPARLTGFAGWTKDGMASPQRQPRSRRPRRARRR
jgi:hypothetical protein